MKKAHKSGLKPLFLFFGINILLSVLSCSSGKSVENNTISSHREATSMQKDSADTSNDHVRSMGTYAHDSIYNSDSVVIMVINDTILRDRWHFRTRTNTKLVYLTDTMVIRRDFYHTKVDTLKYYVTKTKYKEVEKKLSWWEDKKMKYGGAGIISSLVLACMYATERVRRNDERKQRNG